MILTFVADLACFLFEVVHVELLFSDLVELHPNFDLFEPLFDLLLLLFVFDHIADGLLVLPIKFFDAGGVFQQLVDLELVHEHHLVDLSLLQDIEGIRIGEPLTLYEGYVFRG